VLQNQIESNKSLELSITTCATMMNVKKIVFVSLPPKMNEGSKRGFFIFFVLPLKVSNYINYNSRCVLISKCKTKMKSQIPPHIYNNVWKWQQKKSKLYVLLKKARKISTEIVWIYCCVILVIREMKFKKLYVKNFFWKKPNHSRLIISMHVR